MGGHRWFEVAVTPLFGIAFSLISLSTFVCYRNLTINPDVKLSSKTKRQGVPDNWEEGDKYRNHALRKYVENHTSEIMPGINRYFGCTLPFLTNKYGKACSDADRFDPFAPPKK